MPPDPARTDASRRFSPLERTYLWMLLPAVVVLALTVLVPLGLLLRNSLYHWQFSKPWLTGFVGLENYREMLQDARFGASIWRAFVFIASTVAAEVGLALALAELLSARMRGMSLVKSSFLLPNVGYSSALSFVMFLIAIVVSVGLIRVARRLGAAI
jgi:multiple sugar transport system permease protein